MASDAKLTLLNQSRIVDRCRKAGQEQHEAQEKLKREKPPKTDIISIEDAEQDEHDKSLQELADNRAATVMSEGGDRLRQSMENPPTSGGSGTNQVRSSGSSRPFSAKTMTKQSEAGASAPAKSWRARLASAKPVAQPEAKGPPGRSKSRATPAEELDPPKPRRYLGPPP